MSTNSVLFDVSGNVTFYMAVLALGCDLRCNKCFNLKSSMSAKMTIYDFIY